MANRKAEKVVALSRAVLGAPYKYGASMDDAPKAFDCSSFTKYVFDEVDIDLPRSTILQASHGEAIDLNDIELGDLVFLRGERGFYNKDFPEGAGHVMVYSGDGNVIHARSERTQDYPEKVLERGEVVEMSLIDAIKNSGPLVIIRRVLPS